MVVSRRWIKIFAAAAVIPAAIAAGLYLLAVAVVGTPYAAAKGSEYLTRRCGQKVTVERFALTGITVTARGVTIRAVTPGEPPLLALRTLSVSPSLSGLFAGRNDFAAIGVTGLSVDLRRQSDGSWNWKRLLDRFAGGKKKGHRETRIGLFSCSGGAVTVAGTRIDGISFSLRDFSTRATAASSYEISFRDRKGNPLRISGTAVPEEKSLDLRIVAPTFDLAEFSPKTPGEFGLDLGVKLKDGVIGAAAAGSVASHLPFRGSTVPVRAKFDLRGGADLARDEAWLDGLSVGLVPGVALNAKGRMTHLRGNRDVAADVAGSCRDLGELARFIPGLEKAGFTAGGSLTGSARLEGSARTKNFGGNGILSLQDGSLSRRGQLLTRNLSGSLTLRGATSGWEGTFALHSPESDAPVEKGDAGGTILLSPAFRPLRANLTSFSATVDRIPLTGTAAWRGGAAPWISAELRGTKVPLKLLGRRLPPSRGVLSAGTGSFAIRGTGDSLRLFAGDWSAAVDGLAGTFSGKKVAGAAGAASGTFAAATRSASGRLTLSGAIDNEPVSAASSFAAAPGSLRLDKTTLRTGGTTVRLESGLVSLPGSGTAAISFRGLGAERGDLRIAGGAGSFRGRMASDGSLRWPEGSGSFSVASASFGGAAAGSLQGTVSTARGVQELTLAGELFGGRVSATGRGDLFSTERRGRFRIVAPALRGDLMAPLLSKATYLPSGGTVEATAEGEFGKGAGLSARFTLNGRDIAVGRAGRTVASGIGLASKGSWCKGVLALDEATLAPAGGGVIRLSGRVARPAAADREGEFALEMKETPLPALVAAAPALLPRPLQEAETTGSCTLSARVSFRGTTTAVEGEAGIRNGSIRLPSQKLTISGISGRVPISALTGTGRISESELHGYRRDNHRRLVETLRGRASGDPAVTIDRLSFGPVEAGPTRLFLKREAGRTRLSLLETSLFGGALLGEGYFGFDGRLIYGADLAVDAVSLRKLCETIPAIKGYISGKVDGVISLQSQKPGLEGLLGFVSLWAREGKDERMLVSKEFLQRLAGKKLRGIFFRDDRPYDRGEITAYLEKGSLTFDRLDLVHTNFFGVTDLNVSVAPVQNRISLEHLLTSIREAAARGKKVGTGETPPAEPPPQADFKWAE